MLRMPVDRRRGIAGYMNEASGTIVPVEAAATVRVSAKRIVVGARLEKLTMTAKLPLLAIATLTGL